LEATRCGGCSFINPACSPIVTPRCDDDLEAAGRPKPVKIPVIFQLVDVPLALSTVADSGRSEAAEGFVLGPYRTFQIANAYLEAATSYGFGALKAADPLRAEVRREAGGVGMLSLFVVNTRRRRVQDDLCPTDMSPGQLGNTFNRQARATQSVAQDFPPLLHADRVRLQDPAYHDLVGRGG
jgi:hypothetical protein